MLLEVINNKLYKDTSMFAEDIKVNIDPTERLMRIKCSCNIKDKTEPVDLALAYDLPQLGLSSVSIRIEGQEMVRGLQFVCSLVKAFKSHGWKVKGEFAKKTIDRDISSWIELLDIIKEIL